MDMHHSINNRFTNLVLSHDMPRSWRTWRLGESGWVCGAQVLSSQHSPLVDFFPVYVLTSTGATPSIPWLIAGLR